MANINEYIFIISGALCIAEIGDHECVTQKIEKIGNNKSLKDIVSEAFLWAAPKSRRSLEKRMSRKFGFKEHGYVWKLHVPKTNLMMCSTCGHDHEAGKLCREYLYIFTMFKITFGLKCFGFISDHCYTRVKTETTEMQEAIVNTLQLDPVEQDVVVLYEGEKQNKPQEYWKNQRIIELPKPRPAWFHSNLLQPTTQEPSESKEIKLPELA